MRIMMIPDSPHNFCALIDTGAGCPRVTTWIASAEDMALARAESPCHEDMADIDGRIMADELSKACELINSAQSIIVMSDLID